MSDQLTQATRSVPSDPERVDFHNQAYRDQVGLWDLIHDLRSGTDAMRHGGRHYLPKEHNEQDQAYLARRQRTFLTPAVNNAIDHVVSRPFERPITIAEEEKLSDELIAMLTNMDGDKTSVTEFSAMLLDVACQFGLVHVLTDFPQKPEMEDGSPMSLQIEKELGFLPRHVILRPDQVLGWTTAQAPDGTTSLESIRFSEVVENDKGTYGTVIVNRIRIITITEFEIWEETEAPVESESVLSDENHRRDQRRNVSKTWKLISKGTHSFGRVPLSTWYINKKGFLRAESPFKHLAELNLAHWQSNSDQRNITHFMRVPIMLATGFEPEQVEGGINVGPQSLTSTENNDAKIVYVEHSGRSVKAGDDDLMRLEHQMEALSLTPFLQSRPGDIKATGIAVAESKSQSSIMAWIHGLEEFLFVITEVASEWLGQGEVSEDVKYDIWQDFNVGLRTATDVTSLLKLKAMGDLDRQTLLVEMQRRGVINPRTSIEDILARVEQEEATIITPIDDDDDEDEDNNNKDGKENKEDNKDAPTTVDKDANTNSNTDANAA